jgi:hypothetical protein
MGLVTRFYRITMCTTVKVFFFIIRTTEITLKLFSSIYWNQKIIAILQIAEPSETGNTS